MIPTRSAFNGRDVRACLQQLTCDVPPDETRTAKDGDPHIRTWVTIRLTASEFVS